MRFGAEEIVRSTDLLGWDGIRWDGQFVVSGDDGDEISARNTKLVKEIVWKKYPKFLHGYNYLNPQYSDKAIEVNDYPSVPSLKDFEECCRDGGLIMNEGLRDFSNRNFSHRTMWVFAEAMALEGDWVRNLGGHYLAIGFDRATILDTLYNHIFFMVAGARPYGQRGTTSVGHFWRFATRHSALVYNTSRRRLAKPEEMVSVESPAPVWWKPYTYLRPCGDNRSQVLVNLIGQPENGRFNELKQPPPPVQKNVRVKFELPQGWHAGKGYQVSIEIDGYQRDVVPENGPDGTVLVLPDLRYWSIAVLELERGEGAAAIALTDPVGDARRGREKQETARRAEEQRKAAEAVKIAPSPPSEKRGPATDAERLAKSKIERVDTPRLKRNGITDILLSLGVYHWMYQMEEAIGWAGGAATTESKINVKGGWFRGLENSMPDQPRTFEAISGFDVVVLNNCPAAYMTLKQRYVLERFVRAGGGLLVVGGEWSLDRGGYQKSLLEELLPVSMPPPSPKGTVTYKEGLPIAPTAEFRLEDEVNWDAAPHLFSLHDVEPKPDTRTLLKAGDRPLVVEGRYGQGKVIVFTGSTMGMVPKGKLAFWYWDGLPVVFAELLRRLSAGSEEVTEEARPEVDREKVLESVITVGDLEPEAQMEMIRQLCAICDIEVAGGLLGILGSETQLPQEAYDLIARAIRPFVDKTFRAEALDAANSEIREARAVGTSALGLAMGAEARGLLLDRLEDMDMNVQRGAAIALGDLRGTNNVEPLAKKLREVQGKTEENDEGMSERSGLKHDLIVALYRSGHKPALGMLIEANEHAAAQVVRFERRREALFEQAGTAFKLTPKERRIWVGKIKRCGQRKGWWARECRRLSAELKQMPEEWLDVVLDKAAVVDEPASVSLVCEVLGKTDNRPSIISGLVDLVSARNTIVRMLALRRVLKFGGDPGKARAAKSILRMAEAEHHFDRLYALRRLGLLSDEQRVEVLSKLLADIQPEVRTTARALLYLVSDQAKREELASIRSKYDRYMVLD